MTYAFQIGDRVAKIGGSEWEGNIVGFYSTELTPLGYCIESDFHEGSVQIYPEAALMKAEEICCGCEYEAAVRCHLLAEIDAREELAGGQPVDVNDLIETHMAGVSYIVAQAIRTGQDRDTVFGHIASLLGVGVAAHLRNAGATQ